MSAATKSFDRRYFINACWPQLHSTCRMCPSFHHSTCMYAYVCVCVCVCVCDINTSDGYFHHVFSEEL